MSVEREPSKDAAPPRRRIVAANWKMNHLSEDAVRHAQTVSAASSFHHGVEVIIFPPATLIMLLARMLGGTAIKLGAQSVHHADRGAFTGEISPLQALDAGARVALVGHSERRALFGETDAIVAKKLRACIEAGMEAVLCVGETEAERDEGRTQDVLRRQSLALTGLNGTECSRIALAYEPVWAIGTGRVATPAQAQEAHAYLRGRVAALVDADTAQGMRVLYGGSVTPENFPGLLAQQDIDGGLVGGASLDADRFLNLVAQAAG